MIAPIIPWQPCAFPDSVQNELNRRKYNRSFKYVNSSEAEWSSNGEWESYKGPLTSWVRVCSNGMGPISDKNNIKSGFIFSGGKDFYSGYGFSPIHYDKSDELYQSIIGYVPDYTYTPHVIDNDLLSSNYPIHVPTPEIERISVTIQKELYRRATIEWVCFSKKQLEYMTPYFLVPGISCIIEWGWNHYNPISLLDLTDVDLLKQYYNNPYPLYTDHILKSNGNYDILFGIVTNFEWSIDNTKIRCKTEVTSKDRIYAGIVTDVSLEKQFDLSKDKKSNQVSPTVLDTLKSFSDNYVKVLSDISSLSVLQDPENSDNEIIKKIVIYLKQTRPNNWKEYFYGIFYGRDKDTIIQESKKPIPTNTKKTPFLFTLDLDFKPMPGKSDISIQTKTSNFNYKNDFDYEQKDKPLWINVGLLFDIINMHMTLPGLNESEMFKIDIDDCVISGHPNLISCNGNILLIPNANAPKYFYGKWYQNNPTMNSDAFAKQQEILKNCTNPVIQVGTEDDAEKKGLLADFIVNKICLQGNGEVRRDDIDSVINNVRYKYCTDSTNTFEFPFKSEISIPENESKKYSARYAGYLKNLYFNVKEFCDILKMESVKNYQDLVLKILKRISDGAGGFWDLRLVDATGKGGLKTYATMKVVDYNCIESANSGPIYTFDYNEADSLLLGVSFKPMLSNAQAIRTIYAQTNNPNMNERIVNGESELLDYMYKDRLFNDSKENNSDSKFGKNSIYEKINSTMINLQQYSVTGEAFQITTLDANNKELVRRLVLPNSDILKLLIDDKDKENNPKYTGIMPGIQAQFTIQGIGGLRTFMMFLVKNLPSPYSNKNIVFRIVDLQETLEKGNWVTVITAGIIPLRKKIKDLFGIKDVE